MKQYSDKEIKETVYWAESQDEKDTTVIHVGAIQEADSDMLSVCLRKPAECLAQGGLVAFPTETVYGLGANALDEKAAAKIYAAKGRPSDNPLIIHVADMESVGRIVREISSLRSPYLPHG